MDSDPREIVPGKETAVRRPGASWSFALSPGDEIRIDRDAGTVSLEAPDQGTTWYLDGIEETDEEVIVKLGSEMVTHGPTAIGDARIEVIGYRLPEIQDEFERIKQRWLAAGLPEQEAHAYAQGSTHEDQLAMLRRKLRAANG